VFPITGFPSLAGHRVGLWGLGVEGAAAERALRAVGIDPVLVDDHPQSADVLATDEGGEEALARCEVVLKSPGIPRRRADVLALEAAGVVVTSALEVWRRSVDPGRVIAVTGTKGKSTTASVIASLLQALGEEAHLAGNIGRPPYDPAFPTSGWVVLETSSFQAVDFTDSPAYVVVTALGSDHLDWHGSLEQYHADKLHLAAGASPHDTFTAVDVPLGGRVHLITHLDEVLTAHFGLLGPHNQRNVALAVAVVATATGRTEEDVRRAGLADTSFTPLPGRLTVLTENWDDRGITVVDDGLASNPTATCAALEALADRPVTLLVGGLDRGVDFSDLVTALGTRVGLELVTFGAAGARLERDLRGSSLSSVRTFDEAVRFAARTLHDGDVLLLSPAAPSFDEFANWQERSARFAALLGLGAEHEDG
jgi:UDP-N-acetylmuramoyl-L-alanine---L-glutamate ligase